MNLKISYVSILLVLLLSLTSGCGLKTKKQIEERPEIASVDLDRNMQDSNSSQVRVVEGSGSTREYGPAMSNELEASANERLPVVAITLGPGLYRSFLHINVLKALERHEIKPNVYSGAGMGAVVASLYAFSLTPDLIEWRIFNFLSEVENLRPYSTAWMNKIDEILLKDFLNVQIEDAPKVLRLAIYNPQSRNVEMKVRGSLRSLIHSQFMATSSRSRESIAPYIRSVFQADLLRSGGVDFIIAIDALGHGLSFKDSDDFWAGIWGRTIGLSKKEQEGIEALLTLPTQGLAIDDGGSVSKYIEKSLNSISDSVGRMKVVLDEWERPSSLKEHNQQWYEFDQDFFIGENEEQN